jgi:CRP-like cAMP-binding protein
MTTTELPRSEQVADRIDGLDHRGLPVAVRQEQTPRRQSAIAGPAERIFLAGDEGLAWRVRQGVVRLDSISPAGHPTFAGLAIAGDILGCEALLLGAYAFTATALTHCELAPWPEGEGAAAGESLLKSLATAQRRAADVVALRGGQAIDRVMRLVRLLADRAGRVVLPARQDIADITDLRFETISRVIKGLERSGVLAVVRIEGVRAARGYAVRFPVAAAS